MKTRPIFLFAALAAMALSSCVQDEASVPESDALSARIDCSAAATKAILVDNPGVRMETYWQAGDKIGVFGSGASNVAFSVAAGDITDNGRTAGFKANAQIPKGSLVAYLPYTSGAAKSGNDITLNFPSTQTYTVVNGVPAPDASCSIMMGSGTSGSGLLFRNAMAIIKIGQVFDAAKVVKKVQFRGLDNEPLSGAVTLSWNDGAPLATVTGTGKTLTLDCGEGVELEKDQLGVFYMVVPARNYAKGFEITFVCSDGNVVKTVGATKGKRLDRSILYLIGDLSVREPMTGATSKLKPTTILMTADNLDKIQMLTSHNDYVRDENGTVVRKPDGYDLRMPQYTLYVHKDLHPVTGGWMVFQDPTDDLPSGGTYKIISSEKTNDGDYYYVFIKPEANPAAPFERLTAGTESEGLPLDLASYISSIVDEQGNEVPFKVSTKGEILLSDETVSDMLGLDTKAKVVSQTFKSPKLGLSRKEAGGNLEFNVGGSIALNAKLALGYMQGECQYAMLRVDPEMEVTLEAALKAEGNIDANCRIYTINVYGIQVAPGVIVVPKLVITAKAGVGGSIQVSGSVKLKQKLGWYSIAYNKGDGITMRGSMASSFDAPDVGFEFGGVEGSLYVFGGFGLNTYISFYGMAGLGLINEFQLKFGTTVNSDGSVKMALTPEIESTPTVTTLFGSKKFSDATAKVSFEPIWERYIIPKASTTDVSVVFNTTEIPEIEIPGTPTIVNLKVANSVQGISYKIKLEGECMVDMDVVLLSYSGSGIEYKTISSEDAAELPAFRAAGVEHLFASTHITDKKLLNPSKEPIHVASVGVYGAGTKEKTFEGICKSGSYSSGHYYGVIPGVRVNGKIYILSYGSTSRYYNPFIYSWPYRLNGAPYYVPPQE